MSGGGWNSSKPTTPGIGTKLNEIDPVLAEDLASFFVDILHTLNPKINSARAHDLLCAFLDDGDIQEGTVVGELLLALGESDGTDVH